MSENYMFERRVFMKKKYLAKLLSYALSAAMALTSVVPSYAMENADASVEETSVVTEAEPEANAKTGDEAGEKTEEKQEPADEETEEASEPTPADGKVDVDEASDKDPEEKITEGEETEGAAVESEEALEALDAEEEEEPLEEESTGDVTITFTDYETNAKIADYYSGDAEIQINNGSTRDWSSSQPFKFKIIANKGYLVQKDTESKIEVSYTDTDGEHKAAKDFGYSVSYDTDTAATVTIYAVFLQNYNNFNVTVGDSSTATDDIAKADSYPVTVIGTTVGGENPILNVEYGKENTIDFSQYRMSDGKTITNMTGYKSYNTETKSGTKVKNIATFNQTSKVLTLPVALVAEGYDNNKTLIFVAESQSFTISQDAENKAANNTVVSFSQSPNGGEAAKKITASEVFNQDVLINVANPTGVVGRTVTGVTANVEYVDTETPTELTVDSGIVATSANVTYTIDGSNLVSTNGKKASSIVVKIETSEVVDGNSEVDGNSVVKAADGTSELGDSVKTGEDLTFTAKTNAGYTLTKVGYYLGSKANANYVDLPLSADGKYTISKVANKVIIATKTEQQESEKLFAVTANADNTNIEIRDLNTLVDLKTGTNIVAEDGKAYYFSVKSADGSRNVEAVKYTLSNSSTEKTATGVEGREGIYYIPADDVRIGYPITIKATSSANVKISVPENKKAVLKVSGEEKDEDFYVRSGERFVFSVEGIDDTVKVSEVSYYLGDFVDVVPTGSHDGICDNAVTPDLADEYSIAADAMTEDVTIIVKTTEKAIKDDYKITFTLDANSSYGLDKAGTRITKPTATNKVLQIARTEKTTIGVSLETEDGSPITIASGKYEQVSELKGSARTAIITKEADASFSITGNQIGTETLKYTLKGTASDGNTVVYEGTLDLEIKDHYVITVNSNMSTLVADSGFANYTNTNDRADYASWQVTGKRATVTATVKNPVTGTEYQSNDSETTATYLDPDKITWDEVTNKNAFFLTSGDLTKDNSGTDSKLAGWKLNALVAVVTASDEVGQFNLTITEGIGVNGKPVTYTAKKAAEIYAIEDLKLGIAATMKIKNGEERYVVSDYTAPVNVAAPVALDVESLDSATVTLRMFEIEDGVTFTDLNTLKTLEDAKTDGSIKEIDVAKYTAKYYKSDDTDTVPTFVNVSCEGNEVTMTASEKGAYNVVLAITGAYKNVNVAAPVFTFTIGERAATVNVPLYLNDGTGATKTVIDLNQSYLKGKVYDSPAVKNEADNDGYLFQIAKGSEFTLPTEGDFTTGTYTNKKRILVGWNVTADAYAVHGDAEGLTNEFYMPGQTIVVDGTITSVRPLWAYRYSVDENDFYLLVDEKKAATQNEIITDALINNVHETTSTRVDRPDTSMALGNAAVAYVNGATKIGAVVTQTRNWATATVAKENKLYSESSVIWSAYDTTSGGTILPANDTGRSTNTILDKTALANGILTGLKAGYVYLYATYTDASGNAYTSGEVKVQVKADKPVYSLSIDSLPSEIEVGQAIQTDSTNSIIMTAGGKEYLGVSSDKFEYTVTGGVTVTEGIKKTMPVITGTEAGTATVSVKFTDINGFSITSATTKTITVKPASVTINITNEKGKATTETPVVAVGATQTTLYATATDSNGDYAAGTWAFDSSDETVVSVGTINGISGNANIRRIVSGNAATLGATTITLKFTSGTKVYTKDVTLKSYYPLTFKTAAVKTTDISTNYTLTDDVTVTDAAGVEQEGNYVEKVFSESVDSEGKINFDLSAYQAIYSGNYPVSFIGWTKDTPSNVARTAVVTKLENETAGAIDLVPVFGDQKVTSIHSSEDKIVLDNADADGRGAYTPATETLEISTLPKDSVANVTAKSSVSNSGNIDRFFIWDNDYNIGGANDGDSLTLTGTATDTDTARKFPMIFGTVEHKIGTTTITVSATGSDVTKDIALSIYGEYADKTGEKYRYADGTDASKTSVIIGSSEKFYDENGYLIKANGTGIDSEGNLVLLKAQAGAVDLDFKEAKVDKQDGYHASYDAAGNEYFTKAGIVQTGLIEGVNGVTRYANTEGVLVTYNMTILQGTPGIYKDPVTSIGYVIDKETNAAELDDIYYNPVVDWGTQPWPVNWTKGSTYPVVTYDVTYTSKNTGEKATIKGVEAVVTSEPVTVGEDTTKVIFTATTNLTGFFADMEGTKAAENKSITKTYYFDKNGAAVPASEVGEGIIIVGLDDEYQYTGVAIKPAFIVQDLSNPKEVLALGVDYTVTYKDNKGSATQKTTASVTVKGKGNYTGQSKTATFDIVPVEVPEEALSLAGAKLTLPSGVTYYYNGEAQYPETFTIKYKGESAVTTYTGDGDGNYTTEEGDRPVAVSFSNNVNKGSATILVTGASVNGKATTLKKSFTIKAATLSKVSVTVETANSWAVKGSTPSVAAVWTDEKTGNTIDLVEGQDFKVTYAKNKKVNTSATVKITGKGNFTGTVAGQEDEVFTVSKLDLADTDKVNLAAATVAVGTKAKNVKVTLLDEHGDVIPASRYTVEVEKDGSKLDGNAPLTEGEVVVRAVAKAGSDVLVENSAAEKSFNVAALNLSKATVKVNGSMTYTGEELRPDDDWFNDNVVVTIKNGKTPVTLKAGEDFTVTGYTNNVKKGTMKVTIVGLGDENTDAKVAVSGTKTVNVKIVARSLAN